MDETLLASARAAYEACTADDPNPVSWLDLPARKHTAWMNAVAAVLRIYQPRLQPNARRGRPSSIDPVALNQLREQEHLGWRAIARRLNCSESGVRAAYSRSKGIET